MYEGGTGDLCKEHTKKDSTHCVYVLPIHCTLDIEMYTRHTTSCQQAFELTNLYDVRRHNAKNLIGRLEFVCIV